MGWAYQARAYDTRKARDPDGNALLGVDRDDQRHTASYEAQVRMAKTFVRVSGSIYRNLSNDPFEDFYDWQDARIGLVVSRVLTPAWMGFVTTSMERRNYEGRVVPAITVKERDNLVTLAGSLIYQFRTHASCVWSLTYRHQDSNDPRLDFTDVVNTLGVSFNF
jgi:hypothetical protein